MMKVTEKIISKEIEKTVSFRLQKMKGAFVMSSYDKKLAQFITPNSDGSKIADFLRSLPLLSILTVSYQTTITEEE